MRGKIPTMKQKKLISSHGLNPDDWLVCKNPIDRLFIIHRVTKEKKDFPIE